MWGQVDIAVNTADRPRIIPTRVGTRATCIVFSRSIKDHPHACGDKSPFRNPLAVCQGSSPRVWGQVSDTNLLPYKERIIPTRVGTRPKVVSATISSQDHPHAYGDKTFTDKKEAANAGSSPRVWGQAYARRKSQTITRIIPTRMGTRSCFAKTARHQKDHPHAYGDKN